MYAKSFLDYQLNAASDAPILALYRRDNISVKDISALNGRKVRAFVTKYVEASGESTRI